MTHPQSQSSQPGDPPSGLMLSPGDQLILDMSRAIAAGMAEMDRVEAAQIAAAAKREQEVLAIDADADASPMVDTL